jgi:acetolactate synthase-1/3 small subunit
MENIERRKDGRIMTKHTLIALMEDKPGVLNRVASLFRRRSFNIESLTVGHSETPGISRVTIVVGATPTGIEQVEKQLYKLVNVTKVSDVSHEPTVIRELALIKVHATAPTRAEIVQLVDIFRAKVVDVAAESLTIEITGPEDKVDSLVQLLRPFGIKELVRTGRVAMVRGSNGQMTQSVN